MAGTQYTQAEDSVAAVQAIEAARGVDKAAADALKRRGSVVQVSLTGTSVVFKPTERPSTPAAAARKK